MEHNRYEEEDFILYLKELIDLKMLETPEEIGVAKQTITQGYESLSKSQYKVLEEYIVGKHFVKECSRQSCSIPWSEMIEALDNGGLCDYCALMEEKIKTE